MKLYEAIQLLEKGFILKFEQYEIYLKVVENKTYLSYSRPYVWVLQNIYLAELLQNNLIVVEPSN